MPPTRARAASASYPLAPSSARSAPCRSQSVHYQSRSPRATHGQGLGLGLTPHSAADTAHKRTQHTASTAATPRYPQGRRHSLADAPAPPDATSRRRLSTSGAARGNGKLSPRRDLPWAPQRLSIPTQPADRNATVINQSINQSKILTEPHTGKERLPIPTQPADRADNHQSIKGPHEATHRHGEATSQHSHSHRGQQTLRHEVPQAYRNGTMVNQSINQSRVPTEPHTGKEKPIPALPQGAAHPASRSDTGPRPVYYVGVDSGWFRG